MLIPIETHINCDYSGGSGLPIPPPGSAHADLRLNEDPDLKLSSVGQCLMFVFDWSHRGSNSKGG